MYIHSSDEAACRKFYGITIFHLGANKVIRDYRAAYRNALRDAINDLSVKDDSGERLLDKLRSAAR